MTTLEVISILRFGALGLIVPTVTVLAWKTIPLKKRKHWRSIPSRMFPNFGVPAGPGREKPRDLL